ncbi:MAG: peptidoglycan-binding domain-containing protein [Arenicellales bacterium]
MNNNLRKLMLTSIVGSVLSLGGCSTLSTDGGNGHGMKSAELDSRAAALDKREAELNHLASMQQEKAVMMANTDMAMSDSDLLPPNAAPGECYARVWIDPTYKTVSEQVITREESQEVDIIQAQYETIQERVMVSAASSRLESYPAQYATETETLKIRDGQRFWKVGLRASDAPASQALLDAASKGGIDLDNAPAGVCYHEHYRPAQYSTEQAQVLVSQASESVSVQAAQYEMVEERVLVREASTRLEHVPAQYDTVTEQVIDKPAHTTWKKGTGPIQRIDSATGEIMCLVEIPETYKTITRTVMVSGPTTRTIDIPAEYKTVSVRKLVSAPAEHRQAIPAVYNTVENTVMDSAASFVWHDVHNLDEPAATRTGHKICVVETPPEYKTVEKTVLVAAARTETIEIPAEYDTISVTKVVSPAQENLRTIPAEYGSVDHQELVTKGFMEWRSILCDTNMTRARVTDIQNALRVKGFNPGVIDGIIDVDTMRAVNAYQRATNLPVDEYLNIATVQALGVSTR